MISGGMNSGVPKSTRTGVSFESRCARPKSIILICGTEHFIHISVKPFHLHHATTTTNPVSFAVLAHDILGLQVEMHHIFAVHVVDALADLPHKQHTVVLGEGKIVGDDTFEEFAAGDAAICTIVTISNVNQKKVFVYELTIP